MAYRRLLLGSPAHLAAVAHEVGLDPDQRRQGNSERRHLGLAELLSARRVIDRHERQLPPSRSRSRLLGQESRVLRGVVSLGPLEQQYEQQVAEQRNQQRDLDRLAALAG